ncbi:T9SS type B sorting domain-containing protein [Flavobacterium sp. RHBU_3]|uniref:T9SS type B sorting domain-containing protein n=1 Tax=Flavobacterium sp. RHBU_3 TaxID=3391184 RepID=UPI00398523AF
MKISPSFYLLVCAILGLAGPLAHAQADQPPVVTAAGNQIYCPGTAIPVVTSFNITDPDPGDTTALAVYIQISSGYTNGSDSLTLTTTITGVTTTWDSGAGKLTIKGTNNQQLPFTTLVQAVQNVVFNTTNPNASGTRTFSISIGEANYLPSTGHYYRYIPNLGITWTAAKDAAEATNYYGLQGYLATLMAQDEAQLCGEQATGTGWIGGSDAQTEGVWKWVTGPEAGTIFWNGGVNGSTPNFAFWNSGEPNNNNNEDYAHVTTPGVGIAGSWNDLSNTGEPNGSYQPKGYIVEYGGMPGDPVLNIASSTTITMYKITSHTDSPAICGSGSVTLQAQSDSGTVYWYDAATGGNLIATGNSYVTPIVSSATVYYASAYDVSCSTAPRVAVHVNITEIPVVSATPAAFSCEGDPVVLQATATAGTVYWYDSPSATVPLASGNSFTTPPITGGITYYAGANNNGCTAPNRVAVSVVSVSLPEVTDPDDFVKYFCEGTSVTLAPVVTGATGYVWSTGETTSSIEVAEGGTYDVVVQNSNGCEYTATYTVTALTSPVIEDVWVENDKLVVVMQDGIPGNYQYSIDGGDYRASNTFYNVSQGSHLIMAQSINGCGDYSYIVHVNLIPKYFSPNGDYINDTFTLAGMAGMPQARVDIFDRYGKLITVLNRSNPSWDGTFNGTPLPASDYWYVVKTSNNAPEIRGHFSLIR